MNYLAGTKMAFLFRKMGLHHVDARLSDKVFTYDGNCPEGREEDIVKCQNVTGHLGRVEKKIAYYLDRGCSLQEAEVFVKYQEDVMQTLQDDEVFVSKISGLYITWGYLEDEDGD